MTLRDGTRDDLLAAQRGLRSDAAAERSDALRANILVDLGLVGSALDDPSTRATLTEVVDIAERLEDHVLRMYVLNNLAEAELRDGDEDLAAQHQLEAVRLSAELGVPVITAFGLILAARIAQPAGWTHRGAPARRGRRGPRRLWLRDVPRRPGVERRDAPRGVSDALGDGFEPAYRGSRVSTHRGRRARRDRAAQRPARHAGGRRGGR